MTNDDENNVIELKRDELPPLLIGPFQEWRVVVDGRLIPKLTAHYENNGETIFLTIDHRFGSGFPKDRARDVAWLIGQAMAIGAGYSSMLADSKDQPFAPVAMELKP